ncbi:hypothetical protein BACCIP111895_03635 [Neobacillus rhizosphaerae]|uniref:NodB homology domain-containing protein n=1 Tax=Neobacillus rhizosphaerae TaxID=2880965 RepID=A0ABN8KRC7_9BACI|nr:polysaccharide deacetylase family protein [Neobacillus rhizosphaerae]CAH2716448.1 hypothetical protein BACCIP111895_03635 [Neobacillus rhizosphaerae]
MELKLKKITFILFFLTSTLLLFNTSASAKENRKQSGIPILLYHNILKKNENYSPRNSNIINLDAFEEQMKYLHDQGYYTASLFELGAYLRGEMTFPGKTVVLTFDDGHKTNSVYAYPILKKYGFKATGFLITDRISNTPVPFDAKELQFLSWSEVDAMKDVFQYGSHTKGLHRFINGKAALLTESEEVILQDFETSRNLLTTDYFAYPFGTYNKRTIELLKMTGYKYAFTTVAVNAKIGNNPFELGRKSVVPSTSLKEFKEMVKGGTSIGGWSKVNNKWYYLDGSGTKKTGWLKLGQSWYYFDEKGVMKTGWTKSGKSWVYLDSSGVMKTGWLKSGNNWYYFEESGEMKTGWLNKGGKWYFFESSGSMKTGWLSKSGKWHYFDQSGVMKTGWISNKSKWYYFDETGMMKTGWFQSADKWYYLTADGSMKTGWTSHKGNWYFFENSGIMKIGWLDLSGKKYFLNNDGVLATGWNEIEGKGYFFYKEGLMAANTVIDGYQLGKDGARIEVSA